MVIQANMSPKAITTVWRETTEIFMRNSMIISDDPLEKIVSNENLNKILGELNQAIGSSEVTCVEGG